MWTLILPLTCPKLEHLCKRPRCWGSKQRLGRRWGSATLVLWRYILSMLTAHLLYTMHCVWNLCILTLYVSCNHHNWTAFINCFLNNKQEGNEVFLYFYIQLSTTKVIYSLLMNFGSCCTGRESSITKLKIISIIHLQSTE